jgi:enoyl-CoA hydratase/carnithine racemase
MTSTTYEQITTEQRDGVLLVTLSRPERLNAWTFTMSAELVRAIEAADADPAIGAVVVTGAGRGFCAGADIEATFAPKPEPDDDRAIDDLRSWDSDRRDWVEVVRSTKPIVAAVNGVAVGVGLTMILPFDRIIASTDARFSLRFVKMGLVPELGSSHFLPARVGFGAASDLMLSGRMLDAAAAHDVGLCDELVEPDALVATAIERAIEYGENPARQLRWIKQLISQNASESDIGLVQRREMELLQEAYASPEHADAVQAFMEKRRS